jgi:hypothetical protein
MTLELHNATIKGDAAIHGGEQAKRTLAADIRGLDRGAIFQHGQQRQHGALRKIGVLEQASCVADHIAKLERDWLKMRIYSLAAGGLQRAQQSIAPQIMVRLHPGHGFMSFRCRFLRNLDNGHVDGTAWDRNRHFRTLSASESEQKRSFRGRWIATLRLRGTDHRSKFLDQSRRRVRLSDKATVRREIGGLRLLFSRRNQDLDRGPAVAHRMGQFQPVHAAGHVDVRENKGDIGTRFQQDNRFVRIAGLDRSESRFFDNLDGKYPQQRFILHDKDDWQ